MLVVLRDGRQLEGEFRVMSGRYGVGDAMFYAWEVKELENVA